MDGFKDSTRMKYMTGGDVKAYKTGGKVPLQKLDYNLVSDGGIGNSGGGRGSAPQLSPTIMRQPSSDLGRLTGTAAPKGVGVTLKGRFKDGGPVKKALGGTLNERGKRATLAEMEAEDRRMGSSMPAKKAVGPSSVAVSKVLAGMAKPMKKATGGGVDAKLSKAIGNAKAAMTAAPRAKSTFVDTMPKGGPQKPSSGNPLMGGSVRDKYTPTTDVKVSVGLSREQMAAMQKREDAAYKTRIASGEYSVKPMSPKAPSSGNPLTGGSVIEKPQVSGGPVTDPRANIGNTLEIMKKQALARELPTPTPAPKGRELPTPPMMVKGQKINVPPTRGPSMSPAFNDRPMVRRKTGGLSVMPKGKR